MSDLDPEKPKSKSGNKFIQFSGMAFQMGITISAFAYGGKALDDYQGNKKPIWTIILSLLGIGISLYLVIRQVKRITEDD